MINKADLAKINELVCDLEKANAYLEASGQSVTLRGLDDRGACVSIICMDPVVIRPFIEEQRSKLIAELIDLGYEEGNG